MSRQFSGSALRRARQTAGLSAERLAYRIERSAYSIHQYERGVSLPSVPALAALSAVLDVSIDSLFTTSDEKVGAGVA
ncbi:MAG: helix-turn-helix domain-containing protein [Pseudonocardiaceae bacterium]